MSKSGLFITFEGGEGAGKTTLIQSLSDDLRNQGRKVIVTREPGGSELGEQLRHWLLDDDFHIPVSPKSELLLFLADRAQHIEEVILPALKQGHVVFCDRFNDSTIAYQGAGRKIGLDYVEKLCLLACGDPTPDLTYYLDVSPNTGLERAGGTGKLDKIETEALEFHERVRNGFRELVKRHAERYCVLDASESKEEVFQKAKHYLDHRLQQKAMS